MKELYNALVQYFGNAMHVDSFDESVINICDRNGHILASISKWDDNKCEVVSEYTPRRMEWIEDLVKKYSV